MKVQDLWNMIPSPNCKGLCQESCGPILMSDAEEKILEEFCKSHGLQYHVPAKRLELTIANNLICPYLKDSKCSVYEVRPAICRMWGSVKRMPCTFGCDPPKMSDSKASIVLKELDKIEY